MSGSHRTARAKDPLPPLPPNLRLSIFMSRGRRVGIPRAAATRGNDRKGPHSLSLSFSRAWLPRVKNPRVFLIRTSAKRKSTIPHREGEWKQGAIPQPNPLARFPRGKGGQSPELNRG